MLDLRKFYLDNVQPDEYYYSFYDLISKRLIIPKRLISSENRCKGGIQ